jgi:hypothetical protein
MTEPENSTPGIEVEEQELDDYEMGFIDGVLAAWGIKEPNEDQFRDAMELLIAQESESQDEASPG